MILLSLHVLGATVWTGGHIVLALAVLPRALRKNDVSIIRDFEAGYERVGIPALLVQVATGLLLAIRTLGSPLEWLALAGSSSVARAALIKLGLLVATFVLALDARLRIIPRLDAQRLPSLAWHIALITVVAVAFVVVGVSFRYGGI
ncbi:MAG: CopD family protein [Deltaproteobacteria bacterium]|nr:CopD family protein [Deltaproteobacteria bacterium]